MGGDHKCPVCQATFTRPQHVARHMRSHTGDRPYKCQFCGDQFARSDLLARHINKCHADEKSPPNTATGGRRKGSAAVSRATTSKQACDQCVQSSLPCDGSNPCSKCASRKSRCTYVKFHRQTAPSGPGHQQPRSSSSTAGRLSSHLDDFGMALPPSTPLAVSGSFPGPDQLFNTPFTFNPAAATYPSHWTTPDMSQMSFHMASDADMTEKYRAQAEILRRVAPPTISNTSSTVLPSIYATQQQLPLSNNWYPAWGESATYPPLDDTKSFDSIARTHSFTSSEPASFAPGLYDAGSIGSAYRPRRVSLDFSDSSSATSQSVPSSAASSNLQLPLPGSDLYDGHSEEMQRQAHDVHIQRRTSMPTSQPPSFPVSDPSSSQPPPVPAHQLPRAGEGGFSSAFGLMSIDDAKVLAGLSSDGAPFFSNLGIDVLPHSPNATPMPTRVQHAHLHQSRERGMSLGALPTPGLTKEATDMRELKDMWRTYMRSPLSGSGTVDPSTSQPPISPVQMPQSPSSQRRRMRGVTPTAEKSHPLMTMNGHGHGDAGVGLGPSLGRTTVHDDLKRYEAAVNARSASLKLNLVPKRRGTRTSLRASPPQMEGVDEDAVTMPCPSSIVAGAGVGGADLQGISRPSSSSSTSSLAQALTVPSGCHPPHTNAHPHHSQHHASHAVLGVVKPPPMQGMSISLPIPPSMSMTLSGPGSGPEHVPLHSLSHSYSHSVTYGGTGNSRPFSLESGSRASSVGSDGSHGTGTGGSGSDGEVFRPSFKRYPSQTLGPASSKRALVERRSVNGTSVNVKGVRVAKAEDGDYGGEAMMEEVDGERGRDWEEKEKVVSLGGVCAVTGSPGLRPIAALPRRG